MGTTQGKTDSVRSVTQSGEKAAQKAASSPLMEALTRIGYGVRGLIYVTIGILAVDLALGKGGALATPQGAIAAIGKQPAGLVFLWVVLLGVISYALWGVVRAVYDPLHKGHDAKGLIARFGFLASAFGYAVLVWPTYGYITGASSSSSGSGTQKFIATVMGMPWGRWAIGVLGLAVLSSGVYQIYLGLKGDFDRQFQTYDLSRDEAKVTTNIGRFGTSARGVVFSIVGGLIALAAYEANPGRPVGMDAALATLMHQPYGVWILGIVALGLIAFGFYSMLGALWFRLKKQA